jgi:Transposase DDE domain group 1
MTPRPALFPTYRYHAFITDRDGESVALDADHRRHAVVELAIRDLKEGSGLEHCPSGDFNANSAWAVLASIAHNLVRWIGALGLDLKGPLVAKTIRRKFLALRGRLTDSGRRRQLHLPTQLPWATQWGECFERLVKLQTCRSTSRSPAARPATSSANKLQTSPGGWLDTSIAQLIDQGTARDVSATAIFANSTLRITATVD